ncbi:unnamed protein product (macronuclear) [Paramecium tetraurelia]|uniref:Uncharacterized protein n=1 Tax=Paramecium tetraurelia TaxID=5888 RepID=A0EA78_PARTE|nr:uncharacterized protein GSPATT00024927001 [Paramecium tetraurelia]CAK92195.1 unnamed protein product [Paramecium tetraurelia]|eukprot:XP_001459592.1 hypothetical protein (macronuclear) [Paramecium tetraurelia strain d4-2]
MVDIAQHILDIQFISNFSIQFIEIVKNMGIASENLMEGVKRHHNYAKRYQRNCFVNQIIIKKSAFGLELSVNNQNVLSERIGLETDKKLGQNAKLQKSQNLLTGKPTLHFKNQLDCENRWLYFANCNQMLLVFTLHASNMTSPKSHQDCNDYSFQQTINAAQSQNYYKYQDACVSTIDGLDCIWYSNASISYCQATIHHLSTWTHSSCHFWKDYCMSLNNTECQSLDCSKLTIIADCNIFGIVWPVKALVIVASTSNDSMCSSTNNSKGIPCFCDGTTFTQSSKMQWLANQLLIEQGQQSMRRRLHLCKYFKQHSLTMIQLDLIQCVDFHFLVFQQNKFGKKCFFQVSFNQCVNLTCSNVQASYTTHEKCNSRQRSCTVNSNWMDANNQIFAVVIQAKNNLKLIQIMQNVNGRQVKIYVQQKPVQLHNCPYIQHIVVISILRIHVLQMRSWMAAQLANPCA